MAQLTVPSLDFSTLGNLGNDYRQRMADVNRQQTLASLGQDGQQVDPNALIRSGDMTLAQLGLNLQQRQQEQERQARLDQRQQANDSFSHNIQSQELAIAQRSASRADTAADRTNMSPVEQAAEREKAALQYGLDPNSPEYRSFVLGGKLPDLAAAAAPKVVPVGGAIYQGGKEVYRNGDGNPVSPDLVNSLAERAIQGDATWKTGLARVPGLIKSVEEEVAKRGQATEAGNNAGTILQNRANQVGRVQEQRTLGGASATNTLYGNAAASTMDLAIEKSRAVPRTTFVPINQLMQTGQAALSNPALAELRTATNTLVNDYAKAITPVGAPTLAAQEHARELLNMADTPETYEKVVRVMHREIANTHNAIDYTKRQLQSGHAEPLPPLRADQKSGPVKIDGYTITEH